MKSFVSLFHALNLCVLYFFFTLAYPTIIQFTVDGQTQYNILKDVVASGGLKLTDANGNLITVPAQTITEVQSKPREPKRF